MKKTFLVLISLSVFMLLSCGNSGGTGAQNEKITLSVYCSKDGWRDIFLTVAQKIEEDHGIAIDLVTLPNEQIEPVISVKLATNDPPDLFLSNAPQTVDQYNATQTCLPLDGESWVSRLAAPDLLRYKGDGKIYAMPSRESSSFFGGAYYNKALMEQCGLYNPEPKTFREFLDILEKIKQAGHTPIYMTDKDGWCTQVWTTVGWGVALDAKKDTVYEQLNSNRIKFAAIPELVTVLQQLGDLYSAGYVNEDHMSQTYDTAKVAVGEGRAVMAIQGEWFATDLNVVYPDVELGSFGIPFLDKMMIGTGAYVTGWFVPKGKNSAKALEFLNYWSQSEYQNIIFRETPGFPGFVDADGGNVLPGIKNIVEKYIDTGKYTPEFDAYFDSARPIMNDYLFGNIQEVAAGSKTAQEALADWDSKFSQFMKDKEVPGF
ncbi:MAG: ABC transporter substrate-binding protein [Treponema sp.]|jgi:raffinose/stachyose/melibiose transport system substrate-binding protein|nr:ABC transporter substrate-binding protein [Treponema sp.]